MQTTLPHTYRFSIWLLPLLLAIFLVFVLTSGLVACQSIQAASTEPPRLISVVDIRDPRQVFGTRMSVLHPNGLLYAINSASIVVVEGSDLVDIIPIRTASGEVAQPGGIDYPNLNYLAISPSDSVYVLDRTNSLVHMISGTEVITSIPTMGVLPQFITFDPVTNLGYISNWARSREQFRSNPTIALSNTHILTEITRHKGQSPTAQVYNPVDGYTYLGHKHGDPEFEEEIGGVLSIISGTEVLTTTHLGNPALKDIQQIAVNKDSGDLYMVSGNRLVYWDRKSAPLHLFVQRPNRYGVIRSLTVDSRSGLAYVTVWGDNAVLIIDKNKIVGEIPVYEDPYAIVIDEKRDYIYVANRLAGALSVIRGTEVVTTLSTGGAGPSYITLDEKNGNVYVSNTDSYSIAVFGFEEETPPTFWQQYFPFLVR